ncbi:hypothetical protein [Sphingomonas sp. Mn802worker]|uniref:hypothetical protein n=1 Tax=Sphingomonas sp. Mn802worker TaxID=629773 RepID=UPI00037EEC9F|nr:hypothetical protein [Sphingomonas sp. Mn802worker]
MSFAATAAAGLPQHARSVMCSARQAGPRHFLPPDTDRSILSLLSDMGLTRHFMGHVVLTAAGLAVLRVITG